MYHHDISKLQLSCHHGIQQIRQSYQYLGILRRLDEITKIDTKTLIRITEDGIISPEEEADFNELKKRLEPIAKIYDSLRLWEMERDGEQRWKKKKDNDNIDD